MHANQREEVKEAVAGDIIAAVGLKYTKTGDTLADEDHPLLLESMEFPEPVISVALEPKSRDDVDKLSKRSRPTTQGRSFAEGQSGPRNRPDYSVRNG